MKTCGECDAFLCPYRGFGTDECHAINQGQATTNEQIQVKNEMFEKQDTFDWRSFRREAAKDILAGMLAGPRNFHDPNGVQLNQFGDLVNVAVFLTDALITKLKEGEK